MGIHNHMEGSEYGVFEIGSKIADSVKWLELPVFAGLAIDETGTASVSQSRIIGRGVLIEYVPAGLSRLIGSMVGGGAEQLISNDG